MYENDSNNFISNIKETIDVTLATDDDKQIEAHNNEFMVDETIVKNGYAQWRVKNDSNDIISNIKETVDVTLATDDDKQLEAHTKDFMVE